MRGAQRRSNVARDRRARDASRHCENSNQLGLVWWTNEHGWKRGLRVETVTPPQDVITACETIAERAGIDVGGIESMIDDRDGRRVYYDINALSNFVADAPRVVGFDPWERFVDYLVARAARREAVAA